MMPWLVMEVGLRSGTEADDDNVKVGCGRL